MLLAVFPISQRLTMVILQAQELVLKMGACLVVCCFLPQLMVRLTDLDSTIIMEDATDVNLGQSVTRDNLQAITNDFLVLDTAADLEDNILLEDAIATNEGGGRLSGRR